MVGFVILAAVVLAGAIGVITLRQPVHAALALVGTLLALAVIYVTLSAHFLGVIQVIVYAGAIMVLFLFVIMLLNVEQERRPSLPWLRPVAYVVGAIGAAAVSTVVIVERSVLPSPAQVASALRAGGADAVGDVLFSQYVLGFQLVGVLLLVGVVGAVSLVQRPPIGAGGSASEAASSEGEPVHG